MSLLIIRNISCLVFLFLLAFSLQENAAAQETINLGEPLRLAGFNYKEIKIVNEETANFPLIIALHWSGSGPEEFAPFVTGFAGPVRVLLVEGPYAHPRGGHSFYTRTPKNYYEMSADDKMDNLLQEAKKLSKFIEEATALYSPRKKPLIIGASQGGDLSYVISIRYGSLISHSFPLMATLDERIIKNNNSLSKAAPIDAYHGKDDPIVPSRIAAQHIKLLKAVGYKAKVHVYKGIKHDISHQMKADYIAQINRILF